MKIEHIYEGFCPDEVNGHKTRDCECDVCIALVFAEKAKLHVMIGGESKIVDFKEFRGLVKKQAKGFGFVFDDQDSWKNQIKKINQFWKQIRAWMA